MGLATNSQVRDSRGCKLKGHKLDSCTLPSIIIHFFS
jgi:hypothetical protein